MSMSGLLLPAVFSVGDTQRVGASTTALYSDKTIEVAMMLDVTGLDGGQKIKDLKTAASNAVDAFLDRPGPGEAAGARRHRALRQFGQCRLRLPPAACLVETKMTSQRKQAPGNRRPAS